MDGRQLRLWLCSGLLVGGALGCHKQQTLPGGIQLPPGQTAAKKSTSIFARNTTTPAPTTPDPGNSAADLAVSKSTGAKKDWTPDSIVAFADLRASYAFTDERSEPEREKLVDSARNAYQTALKKEPKHVGAILGLAKLYSKIGETARADEMYTRYLALNPKDHAKMHEMAMNHARVKDFAGASAWCQKALAVDPENRAYRKTLGFCLTHAGKWEEGFTALCEVMPEAEARFTMARALTAMNQPQMGQQQLALALRVDPNFQPARELLAQMQEGVAEPRTVEPQNTVQAVEYRQPGQ